jgi:hypothetical protein
LHEALHVRAVHVAVAFGGTGHGVLQPPQFSGSESMSTQLPPHFTSGQLHENPHDDPAQFAMPPGGALQAFVQLPQ